MRIIKINGEKISYVSIPNENEQTRAAFVENNDDCILTEFEFETAKSYKFVNGEIVSDTEKDNENLIEKIDLESKKMLKVTDFAVLNDNPLDLSDTDIEALFSFRKELRTCTVMLPEIPAFLESVVK